MKFWTICLDSAVPRRTERGGGNRFPVVTKPKTRSEPVGGGVPPRRRNPAAPMRGVPIRYGHFRGTYFRGPFPSVIMVWLSSHIP